jgi:hypothetical protein
MKLTFNQGDGCSNDNSIQIGQFPVVDECALANDHTQFDVCGTLANFVNEGPTVITDGGCKTGFKLSINGVSYTGTTIDGDDSRCEQSCHSIASFGTLWGQMLFQQVPICQ